MGFHLPSTSFETGSFFAVGGRVLQASWSVSLQRVSCVHLSVETLVLQTLATEFTQLSMGWRGSSPVFTLIWQMLTHQAISSAHSVLSLVHIP